MKLTELLRLWSQGEDMEASKPKFLYTSMVR